MRRHWPFLLYAAVVVLHHALILAGVPWTIVTKAMLMSSLLLALVLAAFVTDRPIVHSRRSAWAFAMLCAAVGFSWLGDMGLAVSLELGVAAFAVAHLLYIGLFVGPGRARALPWWAIPYALVYSPFIGLIWGHLAAFGSLVALYGLLLLGMAVTSVGVGRVAGLGGLSFLLSETLLVIRMFAPEWLAWFPDPFQDATIMLLYCVGQGLLGYGMVLRLEREPELAAERERRRGERTDRLAPAVSR